MTWEKVALTPAGPVSDRAPAVAVTHGSRATRRRIVESTLGTLRGVCNTMKTAPG